jgi:hypothetical protein
MGPAGHSAIIRLHNHMGPKYVLAEVTHGPIQFSVILRRKSCCGPKQVAKPDSEILEWTQQAILLLQNGLTAWAQNMTLTKVTHEPI